MPPVSIAGFFKLSGALFRGSYSKNRKFLNFEFFISIKYPKSCQGLEKTRLVELTLKKLWASKNFLESMFPPKAENRQKRQKFKMPYLENRLELETEILHGIIFYHKDQNIKVSKKSEGV